MNCSARLRRSQFFCLIAFGVVSAGAYGLSVAKRSHVVLIQTAVPRRDAALSFCGAGLNSPPTETQAAGQPSFDVASIRRSSPDARSSNLNFEVDRVVSLTLPVKFLLQIAYNLNSGSDDQIVGAPGWVNSLRFDIHAKEDEDAAAKISRLSPEQRLATEKMMIRKLLADRFGLRAHFEGRKLRVLALTVSKGGAKLTPAMQPAADGTHLPTTADNWQGLHNPEPGKTEGRAVTIQMLINALSSKPEVGGRLIVDETGLTGKYNFALQWTPDSESTPARDSGVEWPSLFTALDQELGLKLESRKAMVNVLVVDHIEEPSEN